jgi:hypothetical protein
VKCLVTLVLTKDVSVLVKRATNKLVVVPQVGGKETVGVGNGSEGGLEGVLKRLCGTGRGRVGIFDTGELEETLDGGRGNETGTARGGNELVDRVRMTQRDMERGF